MLKGEHRKISNPNPNPNPNSNPNSNPNPMFPNPNPNPNRRIGEHRKIRGYWRYVDDLDLTYGHGTSLAGSIVGNSHPTTSYMHGRFDGALPGAELLFMDIG